MLRISFQAARNLLLTSSFALLPFANASEMVTQVSRQSDYANQEQVSELQQQALVYLAKGGNLKKFESNVFSGITIKGNLDVVEASFQKALALEPERLDLAYDLASVQVLNNKISQALTTYRSIQNKTPTAVPLLSFSAAYTNALGESELSQHYQNQLSQQNSELANHYLAAFQIGRSAYDLKFNNLPLTSPDKSPAVAIIILGYALHSDGTMDDKLIQRLEQSLLVNKHYPNAKIIVSGGVAQGGITESYLMRQWLVAHGATAGNIIIEDKSVDTVANALYSMAIVAKLDKINQVILVTSSSHMRRAYAVMAEAAAQQNLKLQFYNQVAWDWNASEQTKPATNIEKTFIMRDTLRSAGLWAFPGLQR